MKTKPPVRVAYCLLLHDQPKTAMQLISVLSKSDCELVIHLDSNVAGEQRKQYIDQIVEICPDAHFTKAVHCAWGDWNLVEASLNCLRTVCEKQLPVTHCQLLSGADFPLRPLSSYVRFLSDNPVDFIECVDPTLSQWVKNGPDVERFTRHYIFNWRTEAEAFQQLDRLQVELDINREMPNDLIPMLGSQWWTLRLETVKQVLDCIRDNGNIVRFFQTVLIPDESFFQTLVCRLIPSDSLNKSTLSFYRFTSNAKPLILQSGHEKRLADLPHFFARKVSPYAAKLRKYLTEKASTPENDDAYNLLNKQFGESTDWEHDIDSTFGFTEPLVGHIGSRGAKPFLELNRPMVAILYDSFDTARDCNALLEKDGKCLDLGGLFFSNEIPLSDELLKELGGVINQNAWDRHRIELILRVASKTEKTLCFPFIKGEPSDVFDLLLKHPDTQWFHYKSQADSEVAKMARQLRAHSIITRELTKPESLEEDLMPPM